MNALLPIEPQGDPTLRNHNLVDLLERVCQAIEPTDTQITNAKERYLTIGTWLVAGEPETFRSVAVYPQGSFAIGTAIRPLNDDEYDVDLVCHFSALSWDLAPSELKRRIGMRLKSNSRYAPIIEEMPRCWRIHYANEFHLDITPSVPNPTCAKGGEVVPDKKLQSWKPSNPKGFRDLFERRAKLQPRIRVRKSLQSTDSRAGIEPFPVQRQLKGLLRRAVQIAKRHRDIYFENVDPGLRPISVIITTLASKAYEYCVKNAEYEDEFELLVDVIRLMPKFIGMKGEATGVQWCIWNETTDDENFAEKWNVKPELARAFFGWHERLMLDLDRLSGMKGIDTLTKSLTGSFGSQPVTSAVASLMNEIGLARRAGSLVVAPAIGLTSGRGVTSSTPVRSNTFFGAAEG